MEQLSGLSTGRKLILGAGLLLLIDTFFHWQSVSIQGLGSYGVSGWRESVIHKFSAADGKNPTANLVEDASGNLYGTTFFGGNTNSQCGSGYGCGVVFKLSQVSGRWLPSLTHVFHFADGAKPAANLVFDAAGNLYGTAQDGGAHKYGAVFEIQP